MIKAVINYRGNDIHDFEITGHADSGPYGQDIVCAAVSVLSISTVNALSKVAKVEPNIEQDDDDGGYLKVTLPQIDDSTKELKSQTLLLSFQNGLEDIAENYAEYIKIKINH